MRDELRRTAGRWQTGPASPLATYATTGAIVPGVAEEISASLNLVQQGGMSYLDLDLIEEREDLHDLLEVIQPELAIGRARALGRVHGTSAAARWQTHAVGTAIDATSESVFRFMEQVQEGDPAVIDLLPMPPAELTPHGLSTQSDWEEPDPADLAAHARWVAEMPHLWDAYEVEFYSAVQDSVSQWSRVELRDVAASLDPTPPMSSLSDGPSTLRVEIVDEQALRSISPQAIRDYLAQRGWNRTVPEGPHPDVWARSEEGGTFEVVAPRRATALDYHLAVGTALRNLAIVENRSELGIFRDLNPISYEERVPQGTPPEHSSDFLRRLADARRDLLQPNSPEHDRALIEHGALVFDAIADAVSDHSCWPDLVAAYARPDRWADFGEYSPQQVQIGTGEAPHRHGRPSREPLVAARAHSEPGGSRPGPFIRPVSRGGPGQVHRDHANPRPGLVTEPIGMWDGEVSEVVYDRRRFEIAVVVPRTSAAYEQAGWEHHATDGEVQLWVKDRVVAARNTLRRFDQRTTGLQAAEPAQTPEPPAPELDL